MAVIVAVLLTALYVSGRLADFPHSRKLRLIRTGMLSCAMAGILIALVLIVTDFTAG